MPMRLSKSLLQSLRAVARLQCKAPPAWLVLFARMYSVRQWKAIREMMREMHVTKEQK